MNSLMVIDGIEVRRDVQGRYCLNDLHRAAGGEQRHRPRHWIENKHTSELIEQILMNRGIDKSGQNQLVSVIHGGNNQGTYVCKELVYDYAMWISPKFYIRVLKALPLVNSLHKWGA
ncbi:KilA-N domain-containing protein [Salmonella enterica subsp. diarizonae]|nr:KilA-N domain-containing protein [Salmonella enterica subsp. diarizonae]ECI3628370.1 KilA-N domain-containing protein [Salmonella enterica subsp. diarizonae]EDT8143970.1 KilA-N domain-containing protein [Salmonella enterica subsp. diarizonae]